MNPCPCGYAGSPRRICRCRAIDLARYRARISGPLLDRIDIQVEVPAVAYAELSASRAGESSAAVRARVEVARSLQRQRYQSHPSTRCNAHMTPAQRRRHATPDAAGSQLLQAVVDQLGMSARAHDRILKVARTIADLEAAERVSSGHVAEAISYRCLDRAAA